MKVFYFFDFFELVMSNPSPKPRPTSSEIGMNLFKMFEIPKYVFISKGFCDAKDDMDEIFEFQIGRASCRERVYVLV